MSSENILVMDLIKYSFVLLLIAIGVNCVRYEPTWASIDSRPLPTWYDEAKIGIFIHWGVFSVPSFASEWFWFRWMGNKNANDIAFMNKNYRPNFTYQDFANQFTAEFYNPDQWADIFKASGAKYVVLTTKHHEGYTLWPSKYSWNWNSMDIGPNRDLLGDLATAVRKAGLVMGAYHSWFEWFNPLYLADKQSEWKTQNFVNFKARPELEELVNTYKPDVIFSDGDWEAPDYYWNSTDFLAWLYNDSPVKDTIAVNDRWGHGTSLKHGGYYTGPDRYNPGVLQKHKWENAMTIDRLSWGYRRTAQLKDYLSAHQLITTMVTTVSCGGNMLINVGPTHDGRIIPIFEERLRELGSWLSINGEAIYSSKPWTHQNDTITKDVWYTSKGKDVYSIVFSWPENNQIVLGAVDSKTVVSIQMLGIKGNLSFKASVTGTVVDFPIVNPESPVQWVYVLKITTK